MALLDLRALLLDERCVLHTRGTGGDTGQTAKTAIEVLHERRAHLDPSFDAGLHQINPPARRIHLLAPEQIRRARRQTEAAVHALVDQRRRWTVGAGHQFGSW